MGQGRGHNDSQHPGPGAHVRPPHQLPPGGKNVTEKERMSNISQSLTVRVVLQKTISKSNSTILLISKDTSVPMIGKNMFLTAQAILEFLFVYLGEKYCNRNFYVMWTQCASDRELVFQEKVLHRSAILNNHDFYQFKSNYFL